MIFYIRMSTTNLHTTVPRITDTHHLHNIFLPHQVQLGLHQVKLGLLQVQLGLHQDLQEVHGALHKDHPEEIGGLHHHLDLGGDLYLRVDMAVLRMGVIIAVSTDIEEAKRRTFNFFVKN